MSRVTTSIWQPWDVTRVDADVCVVGAGIVGVSTAYWLGRLYPGLDVVLVEAVRPAHGASGRNAGFLLQGAGTDYLLDIEDYGRDRASRLRAYTQENRDMLLAEIPADSFDFRPTGSLTVAGDAAEEARLKASEGLLAEDGFDAQFWNAGRVIETLGGRDFLGGLYAGTGGMLDPAALVHQLVARSGARVLSGVRVDDAGPDWVTGPGFHVQADAVVLAAGPWLGQIDETANAWVRPVRAQMAAIQPGKPLTLGLPVYSHEGYFYIRPHPDGQVLVGGGRHLHREEEVGFQDRATTGLQNDLVAYVRRHFSGMDDCRVTRSWSGTMGFSPDGLPIIDRGGSGALCATGFTGHGMGYGFRTGRLLAKLARHEADAFSDLFLANRLEDGSGGAAGAPRGVGAG